MSATQATERNAKALRDLTDAEVDHVLRRAGEHVRRQRMQDEERARREIENSPWARVGAWIITAAAVAGAAGWLLFVMTLLDP
jgi:fatty acid desaturase